MKTLALLLLAAAGLAACGTQKQTTENSNVAAFGGGDVYVCTDSAGRFKAQEVVKSVFWPGNTVSNVTVWENGSFLPSANGRASAAYLNQWGYPLARRGKFGVGRAASGQASKGILAIYESNSSDVVSEIVNVDCVPN